MEFSDEPLWRSGMLTCILDFLVNLFSPHQLYNFVDQIVHIPYKMHNIPTEMNNVCIQSEISPHERIVSLWTLSMAFATNMRYVICLCVSTTRVYDVDST